MFGGRNAVRGAVVGRLLASRNPWVMLAAGLVMGYRFLKQRAAQGKSIGPFARLPGMRSAPAFSNGGAQGAYGSVR
jgi:hypothetical protein